MFYDILFTMTIERQYLTKYSSLICNLGAIQKYIEKYILPIILIIGNPLETIDRHIERELLLKSIVNDYILENITIVKYK